MILQELFDNLAQGEFSNLAVGNSATGSIKEVAYPKIVSKINRGLREIYKIFLLKQKDLLIHQHTSVTVYYLRKDKVGAVGSMSDTVYLEESPADPFDDDIVQVLEATGADGRDIQVNNPKYPDSGIFTTAFDTVKMTPAVPPEIIQLTYQAYYPKIVITEDFDPETYALYYPNFIEAALMANIASQFFKGKTSKASEGEGYVTNTYLSRFEKACDKIRDLGLAEEAEVNNNRFSSRGWV